MLCYIITFAPPYGLRYMSRYSFSFKTVGLSIELTKFFDPGHRDS